MPVAAKICGLNSRAALDAAVAGGASHVGFVFYRPSPRALDAVAAGALAAAVPPGIAKVGLFVDERDERIGEVLASVPLDMLQLHGSESPARVAELKRRFGRLAMKAIPVAEAADIEGAAFYVGVADWLLFDAKPPADMAGALPGGNALAFDWRLIAGRRWGVPWMLSGGLNLDNLAEAVRVSGASTVDVSSGVEDRPGVKNPKKIAAFLTAARAL